MPDVAAQITDRVLRRTAGDERALDQLMPLVHDEDGARQRSVVELGFVGGLSAEETAEVRAVSPITRGLDPTKSEY